MILVQCYYCGGTCREKKTVVDLCVWKDGKVLVATNVPAHVCDDCGEAYYEPETVKKVEELLKAFAVEGRDLAYEDMTIEWKKEEEVHDLWSRLKLSAGAP